MFKISLEELRRRTPSNFEGVLSEFKCNINPDIEDFIKNRALQNEDSHISRTYLLLQEDTNPSPLLAYFSLALKVIELPENISKSAIKSIFGSDRKDRYAPAFLT